MTIKVNLSPDAFALKVIYNGELGKALPSERSAVYTIAQSLIAAKNWYVNVPVVAISVVPPYVNVVPVQSKLPVQSVEVVVSRILRNFRL